MTGVPRRATPQPRNDPRIGKTLKPVMIAAPQRSAGQP